MQQTYIAAVKDCKAFSVTNI